MTHSLVQMETVLPGLQASPPQPLPFAPKLRVRAFLLERGRGDVLVYSVRGLELGGVSRWYLNHRHEAMFPAEGVAAPLFVHERERAAVAETLHVRGTFSRRHVLDDDFEVIPTPGHTSGATAFLWEGGEHRFLFTGDTIYLDAGKWVAAVLDSSDRAAYIESLELLRELDFDVLVPWAASAGEPYHALTGREDARRRIGAIVQRLRSGENR
jgi:glyoxylase-like metal-dependent hydrolase (beta-lactamase superfamily II)